MEPFQEPERSAALELASATEESSRAREGSVGIPLSQAIDAEVPRTTVRRTACRLFMTHLLSGG
jgi:hypothetical protein